MKGVWEIQAEGVADSEPLLGSILRLAVADSRGAVNYDAATLLGVRYVINLGGRSLDDVLNESDVTYLNVRVTDKEDAILPLKPCLDFVREAIAQCEAEKAMPYGAAPCTLLVNCRGAHSRSLSIAAASIMTFSNHHRTLSEALDLIVSCRGLENINSGFRAQLIEFEKCQQQGGGQGDEVRPISSKERGRENKKKKRKNKHKI
uniref:protein-tyrosine-phosphatase n=1 Tax=Helicotheca tamesis TaxID=374047 RepID=A0A7S2H699_9STRA|mmetsp:Transcript_15606/g.21336  ORF Transcript_15606/g.21336 Transcript_15606/m.21336 type:complete len:204 (+) Transcript_15606:125-736(+)|eukprot:CAMPEP_0185738302 /NCGR_PEP_ID=MMETSP1171-20130828/32524_1 /TAXON_ID=374046 /ORGANISM="Helicotheca tamensis, Strain CCMP826" /LENGTH=203 /DNA_ID=CAMNT_0028409479 /DNA_START=67 /DNA_END=678 /DNA_ORIENTATION=+